MAGAEEAPPAEAPAAAAPEDAVDADDTVPNPFAAAEERHFPIIQAVAACLDASNPNLPDDKAVDMLEFIATQHPGKNFEPGKNIEKADEIAAFVKASPFAVTKEGLNSLAALARHALEASTEKGKEGFTNTPEHQLWLLTSGALNTAAAISSFGGDATAFFAACRDPSGLERGKYTQRHYAMLAMQQYVSNAPPSQKEAAQQRKDALVPISLCLAGLVGAAALGLGLFMAAGGLPNV